MTRWAVALLPWLIVALVLGVCWPGYLSFDGAFQWYQARTGAYGTVSPPQWPALWRLLLMLGLPATTGPLLLIGALHAFGASRLATFAWRAGRPLSAWLLATMVPACPLLLLLLPHVWTDLVLCGALLSACALLQAQPRRPLQHLALFALLWLAVAVRHNGIFAALPLVLLWLWPAEGAPIWPRVLRSGAVVAVLLLLNNLSTSLLATRHADTWAVTPLFDLQAVSVATERQLLPANLVGEGMDVVQLREAFNPYSATTLFSGTRSGVLNPTVARLDSAQREALKRAWLALFTEPTWWSHRWRLYRGLLGPHAGPELAPLADSPDLRPYDGNPPLTRHFPAGHERYRHLVESMRGWLQAPGLYLLGGLLAAWWRLRRPISLLGRACGLYWTLLGSAWMYALPYLVLAPSAETRYLLWPALASWLLLWLIVGEALDPFKVRRANRRASASPELIAPPRHSSSVARCAGPGWREGDPRLARSRRRCQGNRCTMDVLDDVLATLGLRGALYFRTDFNGPWAIEVPDHPGAARFHLVVRGQCHVRQGQAAPVSLGPGDLILIPRGRSHVLADAAERRAAPLERVLEQAGYAGDGVLVLGQGDPNSSTQMICGHLSFRQSADHPFLRALPDQLLIGAERRAEEPLLDEVLGLIARRLLANEIGSQAAATRLSEVLFVELLRLVAQQAADFRDTLAAVTDRYIGRTLQLIHGQPERPWTLASLAREVGMSRTRLADRFRELMRQSPMAYLSEWRLQKALALLDDTRAPVQQVASRSGYQSAAAFTRAFSGRFGLSPRAYRQRQAG